VLPAATIPTFRTMAAAFIHSVTFCFGIMHVRFLQFLRAAQLFPGPSLRVDILFTFLPAVQFQVLVAISSSLFSSFLLYLKILAATRWNLLFV